MYLAQFYIFCVFSSILCLYLTIAFIVENGLNFYLLLFSLSKVADIIDLYLLSNIYCSFFFRSYLLNVSLLLLLVKRYLFLDLFVSGFSVYDRNVQYVSLQLFESDLSSKCIMDNKITINNSRDHYLFYFTVLNNYYTILLMDSQDS